MPSEEKTQRAGDGPWFVYILRCADNSLYTGVTTDLEKRLKQHNGLEKNGARYTRGRQPVTLVYCENSISRAAACRREHNIKNLKKSEKETIITGQQLPDTANSK